MGKPNIFKRIKNKVVSLITSILPIISVKGAAGGPPPGGGTNTILALWTEDIARDWVRVEFQNSIGVTVPGLDQFTITGKTVEEAVMRADKVLYLKVDSDFDEGDSITLSYIPSGTLLGGLPAQINVPITNNITDAVSMTWSASNYFLNVDTDFPHNGKIIKVPAGSYGSLDIGRGEDITYVAADDGNAEFTYCNFREAVLNCTLIGHPARVKNLKIHNTLGNFGIGCFATGVLRFENLDIYDVVQGIQVKTVSDLLYSPYNLSRTDHQTLTIKNVRIANTSQEALYIGSDVAAPLIPITWTIEDIELEDIGRDGVQVRNGSGTVKRVTAVKNLQDYSIGHTLEAPHAHFCLFGTTTDGGLFEDCNAEDVWGYGFQINGYGNLTIKNCNVSSRLNTVYIKNYDDHDEFSVGQLTVTFEGTNVFDCTTEVEGYSLDARRDPAKTDMTLNINAGTTFVNPLYVEDGVNGPDNGIVTDYP